MFAATADQFAEQVRQELWWLRAVRWLVHPDRQREHRWKLVRWLLWPFAVPLMLVYAQALPFLTERTVRPILSQLPWITDRELLARIEDLFRLLYALLRKLGPLSLARTKLAYWLEELDEQLDTLEFVRMHGPDVDTTIAQIRAHHAKQNPA